MKIVRADVLVRAPGRTFGAGKIVTADGVHGVGDTPLGGGGPTVARFPSRPAHLPVSTTARRGIGDQE